MSSLHTGVLEAYTLSLWIIPRFPHCLTNGIHICRVSLKSCELPLHFRAGYIRRLDPLIVENSITQNFIYVTFILQITLRSENRVRTMVLLLRYENSFFNMIVCHKFEATLLKRSANIVVVGFVYTMRLIWL